MYEIGAVSSKLEESKRGKRKAKGDVNKVVIPAVTRIDDDQIERRCIG